MDILFGSAAGGAFAALFLGCLVLAAAYDLTSYTIPNYVSVLLLAGFLLLGLWQGMGFGTFASHVSAGTALLAVGWLMFAFGIVGGGDAKLMAAIGLWTGWPMMPAYVFAFSLAGGVLVLLLLLFRWTPVPDRFLRIAWVAGLHDTNNGVPYGLALAAGAVAIMPRMSIFAGP